MMRGRRDLSGLDWEWALEWESRSPGRRCRFRFLIRRRWWIIAALMALVALAALTLSLSGGSAHEEQARACADGEVSVEGSLSGSVSWCGPHGDHVTGVIGIISVHYPGDENPCGLAPERGPGDSWFEVQGDYELVFSDGPETGAFASSAEWRYQVSGSFSLCGGENSMRVTIVFETDLKGAPAWVKDFGPGAYGSRSGSFKPPSLPEATASPTASATATSSATPTSVVVAPVATSTSAVVAAAAPAASANPAAALSAPASPIPAAPRIEEAVPAAPPASPVPTVKAKAVARAPASRPAATIAPGALAAPATPGVGGLPAGGGGPGLSVLAAIALFGAGTAMMALGLVIHRWAGKYNGG